MKRSQDGGVDGPIRRFRLVCKAGEILLDKAFLEMDAGILGDDFLAQLRGKLIEPHPDYIEKNTGIEERYFGAHIFRNAGRSVQRDRLPDGLNLMFGDVVDAKKLPGGVRAIDFEAFVRARELLDQAEIVKRGGNVKELRVEAQFPLTPLLGGEQVDANRMIEQQISGMLAQDVCSLFREQ